MFARLPRVKHLFAMFSATALVLGVGGTRLQFGSFELDHMTPATVVGILLNLALPRDEAAPKTDPAPAAQ
jgi:xanthine/uracil permease